MKLNISHSKSGEEQGSSQISVAKFFVMSLLSALNIALTPNDY